MVIYSGKELLNKKELCEVEKRIGSLGIKTSKK